MYKPEFPYKSDQVIISSNRVILHSKQDSIFLFGKQSVGLSSTKTINLDAVEKVLIDSPKIELGHQAEASGQPVVLGRDLNTQLRVFAETVSQASVLLAQAAESNLGASMQQIATAGQIMKGACDTILNVLNSGVILSKNTYTK
jgi:hypothetical protein